MKKYIYLLLFSLPLLAASCSKDNYDEPQETFRGKFIDKQTGEPFQTAIGNTGIRIRMMEYSWSDNPQPYDMNVKMDGTFNNTKVFKGEYGITPSGAFAAEFAEGGTVLAAGEVRAFLVTLSAEGQSTAQYFVQGHSFVLPQAAEKQGYTFSGWEYGGRLYAAGESFTVDADALFIAKYQKVSEGTGETPEQPQEPETPGAQPSDPQGMPAYAYAIIAVVGVLVVALAVAIGIYVHAWRKK